MTRHRALRPTSSATTTKLFAAAALAAVVLVGCGAVGVPGSTSPGSTSPDSPVANSPGISPAPTSPSSAVPSAGDARAIPAPGEVLAQGAVLQQGEAPPQLCLGGVAESYPPQCSGPELLGWDWLAVEQSETAAGVTWGTYAVQGTWDGAAFTRTGDPIPLSLYDTIADIDPRLDPANPGGGEEAELEQLQVELLEAEPLILTSSVVNGYLFVTVVYDDGTLQERYDVQYGRDLIAVQSALRPVS
ncbi:hypothetical protein IWX64_000256 [Arthrobacter sp. CAN_A212]|uniref:hypothetical protein n=1 Tax=Arthrobacter sp. CAN_A212 TaxID=2787719 RepID=UPI0018CA08D5